MELFKEHFPGCIVSPGPEFPLCPQLPTPAHTDGQRGAGERLRQRTKPAVFDTPHTHHLQFAGGLEALQAFTSLPSSLALNLGKSPLATSQPWIQGLFAK